MAITKSIVELMGGSIEIKIASNRPGSVCWKRSTAKRPFSTISQEAPSIPSGKDERIVNFFSPMEKTDPNAENVARTAVDQTVAMVFLKYPAALQKLLRRLRQGKSALVKHIHIDKQAIGHHLLGNGHQLPVHRVGGADYFPQIFRAVQPGQIRQPPLGAQNHHSIRVEQVQVIHVVPHPVQADLIIGPVVFAQSYADLYNGGNTQREIEALNSGEAKYSDYMRPGFEFLQTLIDRGYIDAEKALVSEAIEGERADFLAGKTPGRSPGWSLNTA